MLTKIEDPVAFVHDCPNDDRPFCNVYRGEFRQHPLRLPKFWRITSAERPALRIRNFGVTIVFLESLILPRLRVSYGIPMYKDQFFGTIDLCHAIGEPDLRQISWQITALLHHYGFSTTFLDVTFSKKVALFFACYDPRTNTVASDGLGYIYQWKRHDICRELYYDIILTELTEIGQFLIDQSVCSTCRPKEQVAGCIRIGIGHESEEKKNTQVVSKLDHLAEVFVVDRANLPENLFSVDYFFPDDGLPVIIDATIKLWKDQGFKALDDDLIDSNVIHDYRAALRL
ncbi:hypothetical protein C5S32_04430 [ANME-1 cluster archaeon GoMg1]|nr:hypothetical protein [ANME-1 cluster archaeon GoMg1]